MYSRFVVGLNAWYEKFIYLCFIFVIFSDLFFVLTNFILLVDSSSLASSYKRCATFVEEDIDDDDDDVQHLS